MTNFNCAFVFQCMNVKLCAVVVCLLHLFLEGSAIPLEMSNSAEVDDKTADISPLPYSLPRYITLHSETGFNLVIYRDDVEGNRYGRRMRNINELIEIRSVGIGLATLIGAASDSYLAMNSRGDVYSTMEYTSECAFEEGLTDDLYRTYRSHKYRDEDWYLAIDRLGKVRKASGGRKTHFLALEVQWSTRDITRM